MVLWKMMRNINLALPEELLAMVDAAANAEFMSRSEYIRRVLHATVRNTDTKNIQQPRQQDPSWLDMNDS